MICEECLTRDADFLIVYATEGREGHVCVCWRCLQELDWLDIEEYEYQIEPIDSEAPIRIGDRHEAREGVEG